MIADETNNWHYLAVKRISGLLRGITSKHNGDFYCLNCFHSYATEEKFRKHKRICENDDFCFLKMPDEDNKVLKYIKEKNHQKFPLLSVLTCVLQIINACQNNPEKSLCIDLQAIL